MPVANKLAPLIRELCDANAAVRETAAVAIFRRGCEQANSATQAWFLDPELAAYFIHDRAGIPELTVGVAVHPQTFEKIRDACGSPPLADVPPDQDAREFQLEFNSGARLDVLTASGPSGKGAIARFLEKSGESIQQVEINVSDVKRMTELLHAHFGISPVYPATRDGADGTRVNFFLVPAVANRKVLIELVEDPRGTTPEEK
ncbi:MAG: hypothetical protein ACRD4R_00115 [Candidatus Acidiferrales bacterium]